MTFVAINKSNNEITIAAYAFKIHGEKAREFSWQCINCKDDLIIKKEGEGVNYKTSHFAHINIENCTGESDLHYNRKMIIYSNLINNKINIKVENLILNLPFENCFFDIEKIINENRADILIEFKNPNSIIGNGICIEIAVSETNESLKIKNEQWNNKLYSFIALKDYDFEGNNLINDFIIIEKIPIIYKLEKIIEKTKLELNEKIKKFEEMKEIQEIKRKSFYCNTYDDNNWFKNNTCQSCKHSGWDKYEENQMVCWLHWKIFKPKRPIKRDIKFCCSNYEYFKKDD